MSINPKILDQSIALAAIAQALKCLQQVAWKGVVDKSDLKPMLASLLKVNAPSTAAIYGGTFELNTGLRFLLQQFNSGHKDPEFINLMVNVVMLQKTVSKQASLMQTLTSKIEKLAQDFANDDALDDDSKFEHLLKECSSVYQQTLSTLPKRIQVKGDPKYLKQESNQIYVRAILLTAIRACFLWRQLNGSRWDFLLKKNQLIEAMRHLIANPVSAN